MKVDTFFQNFELLTDAPNAIGKLREIILQLSVCGKLSQQADDECASILVSEAQKTLAKLIDEKKYRSFEKVLPVKLDEQPYKIPQNWKWVRIGEMALVRGGKRLPQGASFAIITTPYIYIQVTNMKNGTIVNEGLKYIDEDVYQAIKNYIIEKEDLYISIAGTIGQVGEVPDFCHQMNLTENAARIIFKELNKKYFLTALNSNIVQSQFKEKTNQQAQPKLALKRIADAIIPLPPLAEQKRIVEKCDRLLSTCDEIEKRQQQRQESIVRMNESAIAQLLSSQNPDEFRQHWQRICNNFDLLYSIPETIPKLRQAILQLAVQGKLVPQDPIDEPALTLLKNIQCEKEQLIKSKQIKQDKALPKIEEDIVPFVIPKGWEWCYVSDISTKITDGEHLTPQRASSGYYLLSARNVRDEGIALDDVDYVPENEFLRIRKRCDPNKGDILISCSGSVGRVAIVDRDKTYVMVRSAALVKPFQDYVISEFLAYTLRSLFVQNQIIEKSKTSAQANLFLGKIKEIKIVLPPLAEQKRIVEKCDRLMSLCDTLEARLKQGRDSSEKLMEVAAKQVLTV
ncbi:hypothetical protein PI95_019910 [Hassallia byssoidea VB512170]|uniref:Type I restriction modification DNA specificity domain-containing protein n=1 Tax=Hassallia byssoidea VB512170 TaxID=1304833 RepID=A0A846HDU1_9CYAN|nr:restriction endonuclease subunit S [Hassalia byssoidea]NEU74760.1 hypothetical protein [Hassalia byssoidea VB512170]